MSAGELTARCFAVRNAAHIAHLRTRSYAAHMALGAFYEDIVPLVDQYAETYQGHFGLIETWPPATTIPVSRDTTEVIKELSEWLTSYRDRCSRGRTDLGNLIDELTALCGRTLYKLTNLK